MFWTLTQVTLGGAIGSALRFATVTAISGPVATLAAIAPGAALTRKALP